MVKVKTGEIAPVSGIYKYTGHTKKGISCVPTKEEMKIPLSKGEKVPPIKSCQTSANWELDSKA